MISIYDGFPQDLIVVSDGEIESLVRVFASLGILDPMIAFRDLSPIRAGNPNRKVEVRLSERVIEVTSALKWCDESSYFQVVKDKMLGTPINSRDDIDAIVTKRARANVRPFQCLLDKLGSRFVVPLKFGWGDTMSEALFQFVYVFEKKYNRDQDHFMREASLSDYLFTE